MKRLCALPIPDGLQAFSNTPFSLPGAFPGRCRDKSASRGQQCLTSGLEPLATWAVSLGTARVDGELENTFLVRPWHPSEHRQSSPFPECGVVGGNGRYVHSKTEAGVGVHTHPAICRQVTIWFPPGFYVYWHVPCIVRLDVGGCVSWACFVEIFSAPWDFWIRSAPRRSRRAGRFALPRLGPASAPRSHGACPVYASTHAQCGMEIFQGCRLRNECLGGPSHTRASSALVSRPFFLLGPTASLLPSSSSL